MVLRVRYDLAATGAFQLSAPDTKLREQLKALAQSDDALAISGPSSAPGGRHGQAANAEGWSAEDTEEK